ncbi:MAG: LPS export ABC transporter permease LptF [Gammaproteobacteria bacterium]
MIIERYIHREILHRLIWIIGLLILIFASNKFVDYLADAAAGKIPSGFIFRMMWLKLLAAQTKLLPITLFLAVILTYSRLVRENELVILATAGIGKLTQLKIVSRFTFVFCIFVAVLVFYVSPWAESEIMQLKALAKKQSDITGIAAGKFKEFGKGNRVVYVERLSDDKRAMENVFLQIRQQDKLGVLTSDRAMFETDEGSGNRFIVFENGRRYVGEPGALDYQITEYDKYGVLIETGNIESVVAKLAAVPTVVLMASNLPMHRAELQWRISAVLACFLLALLAVLLNQFSLGQKPYVLLFIAILVYLIYSNLLGISRTLLKRDDISPYLGLWWVHLILIFTILFLYYLPQIKQLSRRKTNLQILPADQ